MEITGHIIEHMIGNIVYITTDPDQLMYIVVGIILRPNNSTEYLISHAGETEITVFPIEISKHKSMFL